jgi:hypothetical protein
LARNWFTRAGNLFLEAAYLTPNPQQKHSFHHSGSPIPIDEYRRAPTLQRYPVYFVRICGFTFEFHSIEQLKVCLAFFSRKVRPSSRIKFPDSDRGIAYRHWACQRWFERLPMQLLEERRRIRIVPALKKALKQFKPEMDMSGQ